MFVYLARPGLTLKAALVEKGEREEKIRQDRIVSFEWLAKVRTLGSVMATEEGTLEMADALVGHVDKFHTQQRDTIPDVIESCDKLLATLPALRK